MSSTNRGDARKDHIADYYITPQEHVQLFLNEFSKEVTIPKHTWILDPCAGGDEKHKMSYPTVLLNNGFTLIDTIDLREDSLAETKGDFLTMKNLDNQYDMIITNPPFNIALDIIKKSLEIVKDNGWVIMLLRLNFLETKDRKIFWDNNMANYIYVHHKRMSFTNGATDSIAYAHFCWQKGNKTNFAKTFVI